MALPTPFTTTSPLVFNIDYFDWAQGAGYKKYYLLGTEDTGGKKYSLTADSTITSPSTNYKTAATINLDFDLTFNAPVDIAAATATIEYMIGFGGSMSNSTVWTIYHYNGTTETSLGTATASVSASANEWQSVAVQIPLTAKHFAAGDILRINANVTQSHSTTGLHYDPEGVISQTLKQGGAGTSSTSINIPFEIQ